MHPTAPAGPSGERPLLLVWVDSNTPTDADEGVREARRDGEKSLRGSFGEWARRRGWNPRQVSEWVDLSANPHVYQVALSLGKLFRGSRLIAGAGRILRPVADVGQTTLLGRLVTLPFRRAGNATRAASARCEVGFQLYHSETLIDDGVEFKKSTSGWEKALRRICIRIVERVTQTAEDRAE